MPLHISFVVAIAENGVIGQGGDLPWKISGDMRHFKAVTLGKPIIMGRKTWDSLPRKPLPGRPNIVVTGQAGFQAEGAEVAGSVDEALARGAALARELGVDEVAIIGGAQIYRAAFPKATRLYITEVHACPEGDVHFPAFDEGEWHEVSRTRHAAGEKDSADFSIVIYERR
ncbi:dihydrofolate reductase [Tepidicaulis marinus]|uniref:Dihydrofolate reductase n=1 Tax=Tepidicaulis marinus TaxID=1333998 RepID=A0A081B9Y0_9HYPH|nr:dihydrofolate reductase [Tepidicaulis marinus]GAK44848.1 dihydrofolate reductase [Tepidicaulis marinus]